MPEGFTKKVLEKGVLHNRGYSRKSDSKFAKKDRLSFQAFLERLDKIDTKLKKIGKKLQNEKT